MLIQVDVDSTLYDADPLFDTVCKEFGIKWPKRDYGWKPAHELFFDDGRPCTPDALKKVFRKCHSAEMVAANKPYPGAATVLGRIASNVPGVEIAYVSDRNSQQTQALKDWLESYGFLYSSDQHVIATKDKRDWMREKRPSIVIDDRVRTMLMARYELDAKVIAYEHNHNLNLKGEAEGIYVCKDWQEIDEVLWDLINEMAPLSRALAVS